MLPHRKSGLKNLAPPQVKVGTPVALMAEQQQSLPDLDKYKPPENVYADESQVRTLIWQSYLKSEKGDETKGCS